MQAAESESIIIGNAQLAVVLGAKPTPPEMRVKELLAERLLDRSGIALATNLDAAGIRIVAGTVASNEQIKAFAASREDLDALGADGYVIEANAANNEIHVLGQSDSGVVAGVGRLMREMRYLPGKVEVPALRIAESPQMPNRGMYLWARKHSPPSKTPPRNGSRATGAGRKSSPPARRRAGDGAQPTQKNMTGKNHSSSIVTRWRGLLGAALIAVSIQSVEAAVDTVRLVLPAQAFQLSINFEPTRTR